MTRGNKKHLQKTSDFQKVLALFDNFEFIFLIPDFLKASIHIARVCASFFFYTSKISIYL